MFVEEPSVEDTLKIMVGIRDKYESHHLVRVLDEALKAAAELSHRYISDRKLPDKAIDLLDEACARVHLDSIFIPENLKELDKQIAQIQRERESAAMAQRYEQAAQFQTEIARLKGELDEKREAWRKERGFMQENTVDAEAIAQVVSRWTGVPVGKLMETESARLLHLEDQLHDRVVGQHNAVTAVSEAIRRARAGLQSEKRPLGSFLFLGPTGVGKTELAKALAEALFDDEDAMVRIDMSEYMEQHAVSKLVGAPPGYVGYEEGGQLTEKVRRRPYTVVLLDEVEKAHPEVFNILLQVLDDGRLTDSKGRTVNFKNSLLIMTSNLGSGLIMDAVKEGVPRETVEKEVQGLLTRHFRPEFLNRIDDVIVFDPLSRAELRQIVSLQLAELRERLTERGITLNAHEDALDYLAEKGFDPVFGARPLKRLIQREVESPLARRILAGDCPEGCTVNLSKTAEGLVFEVAGD